MTDHLVSGPEVEPDPPHRPWWLARVAGVGIVVAVASAVVLVLPDLVPIWRATSATYDGTRSVPVAGICARVRLTGEITAQRTLGRDADHRRVRRPVVHDPRMEVQTLASCAPHADLVRVPRLVVHQAWFAPGSRPLGERRNLFTGTMGVHRNNAGAPIRADVESTSGELCLGVVADVEVTVASRSDIAALDPLVVCVR